MFLDPRGQGGWEWGGVGKVKENRVEVYNEELWSLASRRSVRVKMTSLSWNSVMSGVGVGGGGRVFESNTEGAHWLKYH